MQIVGIPDIPAAITATEVPGMFRQRQRWVWGSVGTGWTLLSRLIQDTSGYRPYQLAILWFMIYECWLVIDYDRFSHVFRHPLKHPCAFVKSRTPLRSKRYCLCVRNARMLRKARLKKVMLRPWWSLEWIRGGNSWDEFRWPTSRIVGTSKSWFGWRTENLWQVLVQRGDGLWITRQAFWFLFFGSLWTCSLSSLGLVLGIVASCQTTQISSGFIFSGRLRWGVLQRGCCCGMPVVFGSYRSVTDRSSVPGSWS